MLADDGPKYFIDYFQRSYHQTADVAGVRRPLVFVFGANTTARGPGSPNAGIADLRTAAAAAGLADPYVVAMSFGPVSYQTKAMVGLGADAVSTYAFLDTDFFRPPYQGHGLPYAR